MESLSAQCSSASGSGSGASVSSRSSSAKAASRTPHAHARVRSLLAPGEGSAPGAGGLSEGMRTRSSAWHIAHLVEAVHALGEQESVKRSLAPQLTHEHWKVRSTVFGAALGAAPPLAGLGAGGGRSEDGPGAAALGGSGFALLEGGKLIFKTEPQLEHEQVMGVGEASCEALRRRRSFLAQLEQLNETVLPPDAAGAGAASGASARGGAGAVAASGGPLGAAADGNPGGASPAMPPPPPPLPPVLPPPLPPASAPPAAVPAAV
mmetsp:Transcript_48514/g.161868  ORF Transcript_48514/g.161868 Transcript_48514/m.161868 type:complete len:264 (+) Transcript_48514:149-940(+)